MAYIEFLLDRFAANRESEAVVWHDQVFSYGWLADRVEQLREQLVLQGIEPGMVTALEADLSPSAIALFLALVGRGCVVVPLTPAVGAKRDELVDLARAEVSVAVDEADRVSVRRPGVTADAPLYQTLRQRRHPGLVLFSSGSTGVTKAAVHDMVPLLEKFHAPRQSLRTLVFLLFDHIGGLNTLLYTLSNGGLVVTVKDRHPDAVLEAIDKYRVELLPTTPTFLNLILLSGAHTRHDLRSLKLVTYGTEPMPHSTLQRFHELYPSIRLQQTYGLSELGILRSRSKASDSLWVKVGGEGFETRVVDGILQVKARSAMLGYLNAPSPFTEDGWMDTGDAVEVDGEYVRILGRKSELINVGGQKVYPAEVEAVLQEHNDVAEATVYGEPNPITGNIVCARVRPMAELAADAEKQFVADLKRYCRERLQPYQVPVKVVVSGDAQFTERFKRRRA